MNHLHPLVSRLPRLKNNQMVRTLALLVCKFGGSSLASIKKINNIADLLKDKIKEFEKIIVVVSAMGEETNKLINMAHQISKNPAPRELDMLITTGERVSMSLLAIALMERSIAAISLTGSQTGVLTSDEHGNAQIYAIRPSRITDALKNSSIVIVAGFQGVHPETKEITTLGRGGSDLTAIALAHELNANKCIIYKDVPGVMTADPKLIPEAKVVHKIRWIEMAKSSWLGAKILHSRSTTLASRLGIQLTIEPTLTAHRSGTVLEKNGPKIPTLAFQKNLVFAYLKPTDNRILPIVLSQPHAYLNQDLRDKITVAMNQDSWNKVKKNIDKRIIVQIKENICSLSIIGISESMRLQAFAAIPQDIMMLQESPETVTIILDSKELEDTAKKWHQIITDNEVEPR